MTALHGSPKCIVNMTDSDSEDPFLQAKVVARQSEKWMGRWWCYWGLNPSPVCVDSLTNACLLDDCGACVGARESALSEKWLMAKSARSVQRRSCALTVCPSRQRSILRALRGKDCPPSTQIYLQSGVVQRHVTDEMRHKGNFRCRSLQIYKPIVI